MKYTRVFKTKEKRDPKRTSKLMFKKAQLKHILKPLLKNVKNILVVKSHGIGNIINITPVVIKLHEMYPHAKIDLLLKNGYKSVLEGWDIINEIYNLGELQHSSEKNKYDFIIEGVPDGIDLKQIYKDRGKIIRGNNTQVRVMHEVEANMKILYEVGFNSKSSFNDLFKKKTGFTPSAYRKMNCFQQSN